MACGRLALENAINIIIILFQWRNQRIILSIEVDLRDRKLFSALKI